MAKTDSETLGRLLHGSARAWRLTLDDRLKPMGLSQAKWRTLLHLSIARGALTQCEIAARLGVEEPTLVPLLHRLETDGWVVRRNSAHDRRCKTVHLERRASRIIGRITATERKLRRELTAEIPERDLQTCMRVLARIQDRAEAGKRNGRNGHACTIKPQ